MSASETGKINTLGAIERKLEKFDALAPFKLKPFWGDMMPRWTKDSYFGNGTREASSYGPALFISGPARNGNHLAHSMLDNHPQLARVGGEDGFLAALFRDMTLDLHKSVERLRSPENIAYILSLSGHGINKWKLTAELNRGESVVKTADWSGVHGKNHYVNDYQDTAVKIDYAAFEKRLHELSGKIRKAGSLVDVFWYYLDALTCLDPERREGLVYPHVFPGSGMRAETRFLLERGTPLKCVAPIRPFENFYFSFAKGRKKSEGIDQAVLKEAWEHWHHKVIDYLILKRDYPGSVCLVNFTHLIEYPEATAREICAFLGIEYSETCLTPTSMGEPTKGNSSFPKGEEHRGTFYRTSLGYSLEQKYWPDVYPQLWNMVSELSV